MVLGPGNELAGEGREKGRVMLLCMAGHWQWLISLIVNGHFSWEIAYWLHWVLTGSQTTQHCCSSRGAGSEKGVGRGESKKKSYIIVHSRTLAVINWIDSHFSWVITALTSSSANCNKNTQHCCTVGWGSRKQWFSHQNWLRAVDGAGWGAGHCCQEQWWQQLGLVGKS